MSIHTRRDRLIALLGCLVMAGRVWPAEQTPIPALIPLPVKYAASEAGFVLASNSVIRVSQTEACAAMVLADLLARSTGVKLGIRIESEPAARDGGVALRLDTTCAHLGEEGYVLEVAPMGISITAARSAGLIRGAQTLVQLLPAEPGAVQGECRPQCARIEDMPRFGWRGYLLDSSRHFITKQTILKLLDALAMFKINVFHWHMTDDQAWRLAIGKYPRLVELVSGSWNASSQAEGYYSGDDVREIVERARRLHIMIVPEIEMPSHATQAATVITEGSCLGADGKPLPPGATREICLGSDKAIAELQDILVQTMALFPDSPYIHLGGDEAEDKHWRACSRCQARMRELGITDPRLMQKWFMARMNRFVRQHGRVSMAWADRLSLGMPEGQIVHGWHAGELEEAVAKGFRAVQSQHDFTYFDYGQGLGDTAFGGNSLDTAKVYAFDPVQGLTLEESRLVLGPQAQLWTELVTDELVFEKTFPRILALAEVGWTPQDKRDGAEFATRLQSFLPRLDALGIPRFMPPVLIGTWTSEMMSPTWKDLEWNVTAKISKAGPLVVEVLYQKGAHAVEIQSVTLLEDGREISRDEHNGITGAHRRANVYQLRVTAPKPGAVYTLRARMQGSSGGTDSHGVVLLR